MSAIKPMLLLWFAMLLAAAVQAQELNQKDPAEVARAYVQACEKWDTQAASRVVLNDGEAEALQQLLAWPGPALVEQSLAEALCMPLARHNRYVVGEVATTGDEARVRVVATYAVPLTLVLKKGDDGKWRVAVRESLLSTTGAVEPMLFDSASWLNRPGMSPQEAQEACLSNLKQLGLGVLMYAQDHNEVLPPAETWCDDMFPYLKNAQVYCCPLNPYGYTYNVTLSRKPLAQIERPAETILFFELGHREQNAAADPTKVQAAHRHGNGDNFAYADGHVKWLAKP
jgi:prepilin-type processing-associated H-X9-DG protein